MLVRIDRLAAGGDGVARMEDGRALFVPLSAPGDFLRVRIVERKRRFARGELVEVIEAGPGRITAPCEVFGRCGGCVWQHLDYDTQIEAKRSILCEALQRIGGFELPETIRFSPSPSEYGYRQRARLLHEKGKLGFRSRRSHALCATRSCPVLLPSLEAELSRLGDAGLPGRADFPRRGGDEWELLAGVSGVRLAPLPHRAGEPHEDCELQLGRDRLRISPGVFVQANALLQESLVAAVCEAVLTRSGAAVEAPESLLELYAGAGTLTLALARDAKSLCAVESNPASAADLRHNLASAGLGQVRVLCERSDTALAQFVDAPPDVIVLDPPRSGLERRAAEELAELGATRIVYLSCDPATLARDLAVLRDHAGYRLTRAQGFDLFPQTAHVEALCVMEAGASSN